MDRDKVIKGLECCTSFDSVDQTCMACPFEKDCVEKQRNTQLLHDALALMKEQEAVPVTQREVMHMLFWCCGSCGVAITDGDKFCRMCGKAVKWNDD